MQFFDLNLSEVTTDTINNLSDISFSADTPQNMKGGGLFSLFTGSSKVEKAVLDAAKEKNFAIVEFMIDKGLISSYGVQDKDGNTLLHYLVVAPNPNLKLIEKIIKQSNSKSFVNKQNNDGDTPLILAVKSGQHDLCTALISSGADKSIKNKNGLHVDTETEEQFEDHKYNMPAKTYKDHAHVSAEPLSRSSPLFEFQASPQAIGEILEPIKRLFNRSRQQTQLTSEPAPIQLSETQQRNPTETEEFIQKLQRQLNSNGANKTQYESNTEETIQRLNKFIGDNEVRQSGGSCGCGQSQDTEKLMSSFENYFGTQAGGIRKKSKQTKQTKKTLNKPKMTGTRKIKSYIDTTVSSERGTDLSRVIHNQASDMINRAVKNIQTILTDNKKDFKGIDADENTARAIKAIIWKSLRENNPEMKSSLDIAVEMEKLINKDYIKKINAKQIKEMSDTLRKHAEEKQHQRKDNDTISSTSSESVPSESNMSATSI